jgi:outer membrane protein TolC
VVCVPFVACVLLLSGVSEAAADNETPALPARPDSTSTPSTTKIPDLLDMGPLASRITVNISGVMQPEQLPVRDISPILIDSNKERTISIEQVLGLAALRNLPYRASSAQNWAALYGFASGIAGMNPVNEQLNATDLRTILFSNESLGQLRNQVTNQRVRFGTYGLTISNGGTSLLTMVNSLFNWRALNAVAQTALQDALAGGANAYYTLCQQISLLHVADIVVENSRRIAEINTALYESGLGTKLQVLQAETQLAQDRQALVQAQVRARVSAINLAVVLNLPLVTYLLPDTRPLDKVVLVNPALSVAQLEKYALDHRPEIVQQRNIVRQQLTQAGLALTPMVPTAQYSQQKGKFLPFLRSAQQQTLSVQWTLPNSNSSVIPNFASGLASARAAQYNLQNTELQVRAQVRQAFDTSLGFLKNIEIARIAASKAQEQLSLAEDRLRVGVGINIDVIQAQSALTIALQNYVNAIYNYNLQQVALRRAIGAFTPSSVKTRLRFD